MSSTASTLGRGWVAAFGKHPGWDDHIDDIGLVTPELIAFKRLLYFEGVGTNIDAGTWERLPSEHRLPNFGHSFLACGGGRLIVGRLWASKDRKGRSLYPMVVCLQTENVCLATSVAVALPLLQALEAQCRATESATAVQSAIAAAQARLANGVFESNSEVPGPVSDLRSGAVLAQWAERIQPDAEGLGFQRLCHRFSRDFVGFQRSAATSRSGSVPAQHLRVPACETSDERALLLWVALLRKNLPGTVPLLLFRPFDCDWLDVLVGTAQAQQFACLLSGRESIPWVTEIPYTLDPDAREKGARLIDGWRSESEDGMQALWQIPSEGKENTLSGWWQRVQDLVR